MNKASIRQQIEQVKREADETLSSGKLQPEAASLIKSLMLLVEIMVSVLLEKNTRKNSSNSGLPPSRNNGSNGNRNKKLTNDRNKLGDQVQNTRKKETSETIRPNECKDCGEDLCSTEPHKKEERKKVDIIYETVEHTIISEVKKCPKCGQENKGQFPKSYDGPIQYGIGIKASIINFLMVQMISLERVSEHFKGLIGRLISQSVMLKYVAQLSALLESWEKSQIEKLMSHPSLHCDETSLRVDKKNYWVHSYSAGEITLKFLHKKRGKEAIEEIGIIPRYGGKVIHDCWASYMTYEHVEHGLCGAHLLRELKFVEDSTGDKWSTRMKELLKKSAEEVSLVSNERVLKEKEYEELQSRYQEILAEGKKELPAFPESRGKRGRPKHTEAQNLWLRLKKHESSVLLFARDKDVAFTNNRAERDLRDSKLKQKVSGTFRKLEYAEHFVRISSFVKTMRYKGYSSLESIMLALQGQIPS